jgi:hypothetical protein
MGRQTSQKTEFLLFCILLEISDFANPSETFTEKNVLCLLMTSQWRVKLFFCLVNEISWKQLNLFGARTLVRSYGQSKHLERWPNLLFQTFRVRFRFWTKIVNSNWNLFYFMRSTVIEDQFRYKSTSMTLNSWAFFQFSKIYYIF